MKRDAFKAALPYTLPICIAFLFIGISYGFYMTSSGFSFWYPMVMSLLIFAGSMEFVAVPLLLAPFAPVTAFILTLMVNARHLFYGISMLRIYTGYGWKTPYLIFGMCDESFSINCTIEPPAGIDKGWFMFFVTLLNHLYWVLGATLGGILGSIIHINTKGIEFVLTALFVVMFVNQWQHKDAHRPALIGLACTAICLFCFGSQYFLIPAMVFIALSFWYIYKRTPQEDSSCQP